MTITLKTIGWIILAFGFAYLACVALVFSFVGVLP